MLHKGLFVLCLRQTEVTVEDFISLYMSQCMSSSLHLGQTKHWLLLLASFGVHVALWWTTEIHVIMMTVHVVILSAVAAIRGVFVAVVAVIRGRSLLTSRTSRGPRMQPFLFRLKQEEHIDGLVQERRNSSALAMELRLSCINPSIWFHMVTSWHGHTFRITSPLWGEPALTGGFSSHWASDAELWSCWHFLYCSPH